MQCRCIHRFQHHRSHSFRWGIPPMSIKCRHCPLNFLRNVLRLVDHRVSTLNLTFEHRTSSVITLARSERRGNQGVNTSWIAISLIYHVKPWCHTWTLAGLHFINLTWAELLAIVRAARRPPGARSSLHTLFDPLPSTPLISSLPVYTSRSTSPPPKSGDLLCVD